MKNSFLLSLFAFFGLMLSDATGASVSVTTSEFRLSIKHDGVRQSTGAETLTYGSRWDGDVGATITIAQDGSVLQSGLSGEGMVPWSVERNGTYVLTHTTYTNGVAGKVETATFVVTGKEIPVGELDIDWGERSFVYDGTPKCPAVIVKSGAETLAKGTDYTVECLDNINVGTARVIVNGCDLYIGSITNTFAISKGNLSLEKDPDPIDSTIDPNHPDDIGDPDKRFSVFDYNGIYDGTGHTIETNALTRAFSEAMGGEVACLYGTSDAEDGVVTQWFTEAPVYTNAGAYVVWYKVVSANYTDIVHPAKVTIEKRDLSLVQAEIAGTFTYTGSSIAPVVTVQDGTPSIVKASDYALSYADNILPGTARAILTAKVDGNYVGTKEVSYQIRPATIRLVADGSTGEYYGSGYGISVNVLKPSSGYTIKYAESADGPWLDDVKYVNVCTEKPIYYQVTATGYATATGSANVTIAPKTLTTDYIWLVYPAEGRFVYTGEAQEPEVFAADGDPSIITDDDWEISYANNVNAGTAIAIFTGKGNYTGTCTEEFEIEKATYNPGDLFLGLETATEEDGILCERVYNGLPQPFEVDVAESFTEPYVFSYALTPGAYTETAPTLTNVADGALKVYFMFVTPNYEPYEGFGTLRILPKEITEEMVQPGEDAFFWDGIEKMPTVMLYDYVSIDGIEVNVATESDFTHVYGEKVDTGVWTTVTAQGNYTGTVTKIVPILKRPVTPPVITSKSYNGQNQTPTIPTDERWAVVSNPGGVHAGSYTNVILRLTNTSDFKWKGQGEEETDWTGVFTITRANNGWTGYPNMTGWVYGETPSEPQMGRVRYGTVKVAYRRKGTDVSTETSVRPELPGIYIARFWADATQDYIGVSVNSPYREVEFEITGTIPGGTETLTTPVPVPYTWLDSYVEQFGGDYERAANAKGLNGVTLWESYVAGLVPTDPTSRFRATIEIDANGKMVVTWKPDLREANPPRTYIEYGKEKLTDAEWTPVTAENRDAMRFFKVGVKIK